MEHRIRRLERAIACQHGHINRDELKRRARAIAVEEGVDPDEAIADVLALAERTAGMTVPEMAAYLADDAGIPVAQLLAEATTQARTRGMTI